jgi:hypothetical protein
MDTTAGANGMRRVQHMRRAEWRSKAVSGGRLSGRAVALSERSLSEGGGVEELPRCGPTVRHGAVEGGCA